MLIDDSQLLLSNHYSGPTADGRWSKVACSNQDWATEAVIYDGMVQEFLGRDVQFVVHDGKATFITANLGIPYSNITTLEMLDIAQDINSTHAPLWAKSVSGHKETLTSRVRRRYQEGSPRCLEWSLARFEEMDFSVLDGECLVHTDLNPKNIVIDPTTNKVSVIDWESCVKASADMELAHLARGLLMRSESLLLEPSDVASSEAALTRDEAQMILERVSNLDAFVTALVSKIVSSASWVYKRELKSNPQALHDAAPAERAVQEFVQLCNQGIAPLEVRVPQPFDND